MVQLADQDNDSIADLHEQSGQRLDSDGDGTSDYLDNDSDGDGISDRDEAGDDDVTTRPADSDTDGEPDYRDLDADNNGIADKDEPDDDLDGDGLLARVDLDDDGDGLSDTVEIGDDPTKPRDSDADGVPDYLDSDSDDDGIADLWEGAGDPDGDLLPSYLDVDSDGDCRTDEVEGGIGASDVLPVDSDGDGVFDFLDLDSDNDGLGDEQEDRDCDGKTSAAETAALDADTDGDGATDLVEQAAGTDPILASDNPIGRGDFVFVVPFNGTPTPGRETLDFATDLVRADVVLAMDGTRSMDAERDNLKSSLRQLAGQVGQLIPDVAFGVVTYRDYPYLDYGHGGDRPFQLRHRVMTVRSSEGMQSVQAAVGAIVTDGGKDPPESGFEMLYQLATGAGRVVGPDTIVDAFDASRAPPAAIPAGEEVGTRGGVGLREGALPIAIWATDACNHNAAGGRYPYHPGLGAATEAVAIEELAAIGARVLAVVSDPTDPNDTPCPDGLARKDALAVVTATRGNVGPQAWGNGASRPQGCEVGQCCTGLDGRGEAPDIEGMCPLVFHIDGATGAGLGHAALDAVRALSGYGTLDITAEASDGPDDEVDAVQAFIAGVIANTKGDGSCAAGLSAVDRDPQDGIAETFDDVQPGERVCFDIVPKPNTTVEPTAEPQLFRATVTVRGDGVTVLDARDIYFLVPPKVSSSRLH